MAKVYVVDIVHIVDVVDMVAIVPVLGVGNAHHEPLDERAAAAFTWRATARRRDRRCR